MAAVDSLLNAAPPVPPVNVTTQQPFASITAYFFSKTDTSPVWTIGFRCRSDQNYKAEGDQNYKAWYFAQMTSVRTVLVNLQGIKTNFLFSENGRKVTVIKLCYFIAEMRTEKN